MYSTEGTSTMKPGLIVVDMQIRFEQVAQNMNKG